MSHSAVRAQALREVVLDLLQGFPLRLQQAEVEENDADATDGAVEEESAVQLEGMLDVEVRLGAEEQEHVTAGSRDAPRQSACPATC